ncbi:MAG TPA: dynamin family protein [Candidatus Dormibacteraeota bacterium]|nr:dynamin family protein [Candidatus Dormibacteraeota bacterium]
MDADAMLEYEQARDALVTRLLAVEPLLDATDRKPLTRTRAGLQRDKFVLAVVGEFSSGKSFLLNALLGKFTLLATDINPSTATITELEYGTETIANAIYEDGRTERIPLDRLNRFIAVGSGDVGTLHDATKDERDTPIRVVVRSDSPFLQRGFLVADTPGLASINPAHRRATLQFLPTADAVLYLIDTQQPFTDGDAAFLGIIRKHIDSIFIVQTKIDLWRQPQSDGRPAWEHANERIANLAAVHAPGTYVYALSAREYIDGITEDDAAAVERSRFGAFLSALDASLIKRTGRARLTRVRVGVDAAVADAQAQIARDLAMLSLDSTALHERRAEIIPALRIIDERTHHERDALLDAGAAERRSLDERGRALANDVEHALSLAFDTADIARLRDRARLHIIVDRVLAHTVDDFAHAVAADSLDEIDAILLRLQSVLVLRWKSNEAAARAFSGDPGTSLWSGDVRSAIAATIVLDAIGGPAITLVHDIAARFAAQNAQTYMKRELIADLRSEIFPRLRGEILSFATRVGARLQHIYDDLAEAISQAALAARDAELGAVDRALRAHADATTDDARIQLTHRRDALAEERDGVAAIVERFMQREEEIAIADPGATAVRIAHADASEFDPGAYDLGLRPTRWRVAILGALRRGKSSLINAFAGRIVLTDDTAGSVRFPIHVRFGERESAFVLAENGEWREIAFRSAAAAAANAPVLVLVPWTLPRELVLVHAPAFDTDDAFGEDVNAVVASHASEVLCLFSRQLSDRELALYERVAEMGKPMLFAHTIADNEAASERRHVVALAEQYLRGRNIPAERIFVVSAHEYAQAEQSNRASAAWNETQALRSTLEAHAESHMARLGRLARTEAERAKIAEVPPRPPQAPPAGFLARIFRKGRTSNQVETRNK